jgi:hypothetical protein
VVGLEIAELKQVSAFFGINLPPKTADGIQHIDSTEAWKAVEILIPKKSPKPLIRLGSAFDGGYLLPDDLTGISRCLSPGVNNFKFFEDDLATKHNIKCDLVDASSDVDCFATQLIDGMQTFYPQWLDTNNSNDSLSIAEWISMHSGDREDFLLQIDIEGAEYRNLLSTDDHDLGRFRILILELHRVAATFTRPRIFYEVMRPLLAKLDRQFICVHAHPNNALGFSKPPALGFDVPRLLEVTFLRRDRFPNSSNNRTSAGVSLPHPLDSTNVLKRAPFHLDTPWSKKPRDPISSLRMAKDWINFFRYHNRSELVSAHTKLWLRQQA